MNFSDLLPFLLGAAPGIASGQKNNIDPTTLLAGGIVPGLLNQNSVSPNSNALTGILSPNNSNVTSNPMTGFNNSIRNLILKNFLSNNNNASNFWLGM